MNKMLLVSGHGNFASGLQSSIHLLVGENNDFIFIDFTIEDTSESLKEKMLNIILHYIYTLP